MTFKRIVLLAAIILLAGVMGLALASCSPVADYSRLEMPADEVEMAPGRPVEEYMTDDWDMARGEPAGPDHEITGPVLGDSALRHVIRRGSIDLTVSDTRAKIQEVQKIARDAEGIIGSSYIYEIREGQYAASMTLRIPEQHFDNVLEQLENLGKATNISTELEDVTMQYVDLQSRLNNQKAQEGRLTEILEMAETVEEVLEVEKELNRVRGEIEAMTARLIRLEDQITYATIHVSLRDEAIPTGTVSPQPFHNLGRRISETFIGSINFILNAASGLLVLMAALIPALIVLIIIGIIVWLIIRRSLRGKAAPREHNEEPAALDE